MENTVNQQGVSETDKAWLAGIIEGDGSISMGFHMYQGAKQRRFSVKPTIQFTNQDALLIERVSHLMKSMGEKNVQIREIKGRYENSKDSLSIQLVGMKSVLSVLAGILPHLKGQKSARARMLSAFIDHRLMRVRESQGNPPYDLDELRLIETFCNKDEGKGGRRNPEVRKTLRDFVYTAEQAKIKSVLHGDMKSPAEMTGPR